jgi:hypothetical protein
MPAYRSSAEGEVREAVVAHLRTIRPKARIIHEINCSTYGPNRIDVLAVSPAEILAVEIKSKKDKLDRLPAQIASMKACSHHVFAALHEKFLRPLGRVEHDYGVTAPEEASGAIVWVFPRADRKGHVECKAEWIERDRWAKPKACLPPGAINLLWREELVAICAGLGVRTSKLTMEEAVDIITWRMTGEQVTRAICSHLRARRCVEADPEIMEVAA